MPPLPFAPYAPDISDVNSRVTSRLSNCVPRADGYGPFKTLQSFTQALPADCRGFFFAEVGDGSVAIFAGTSTKLYLLNNTTLAWGDVSKSLGTYTTLAATAQWRFAQFNTLVFATQQSTVLQVYNLSSSSEFADCAGSPPQAGGIAVVNRFLVLFDLLSNQNRIQWSGLNATTTWTSGTNLSDYQDLPDGGRVRGVAGGEFGIILQATAIRRMVFTLGAPYAFTIERITKDRGILAPYSLIEAGGNVFFHSTSGFVQMAGDGGIDPIGAEAVDRTFLADYDSGQPQLMLGAADTATNTVFWVYKSLAGISGHFDKGLAYNWLMKRWSPITATGQYLAQAARPGLTLEGLDALAPGAMAVLGTASNGGPDLIRIQVASTSTLTTGNYYTLSSVGGTTEANGTWQITVIDATHFDLVGSTHTNAWTSGGVVGGALDDMEISLDELSSIALPAMAAVDTDLKLAFFTGSNLEATLEVPEQRGEARRLRLNGLWPITDADDVYGFARTRELLSGTPTDGDESAMDEDGFCAVLEDGRGVRPAIRIPAGTTWSFATGIEADLRPSGGR